MSSLHLAFIGVTLCSPLMGQKRKKLCLVEEELCCSSETCAERLALGPWKILVIPVEGFLCGWHTITGHLQSVNGKTKSKWAGVWGVMCVQDTVPHMPRLFKTNAVYNHASVVIVIFRLLVLVIGCFALNLSYFLI